MSTREHTKKRIAITAAVAVGATAAVALAAVGCEAFLKQGDVSPQSVEQQAHTLTQQTLDAIRPAVGAAATSAEPGTWDQCTTELPGQHRFAYRYVLDLHVPMQQSKAVMDAAQAYFAKQGYKPDVVIPHTRVGATETHSSWWIGVGVSNGNTSMFISVDSKCVFTTHDPPATTSPS